MMARVELQTAVALPPEVISALLIDPVWRLKADPTLTEIEPSPGAESTAVRGVTGAQFRGRGTTTGSIASFEAIILNHEPARLVAVGFYFANGARLQEEWRLRPVPSGTLVTYHADMRLPGGFAGRLLDRLLVGSGFRRQREAVLQRFKATAEAGR